MKNIKIKRIYDTYEKSDGYRVLVDRLWPRGMTKAKARLNLWAKEIAPSAEIRKEFGHKDSKWESFKTAYLKELKNNPQVAGFMKNIQDQETVTLIYAAKSEKHNTAAVLREYLIGL